MDQDNIPFRQLIPDQRPELREGRAQGVGEGLWDWIASKTSPAYADRVAGPFKAINDYIAEPMARGVDTVTHPGGHTGGELAGGALDASGLVPQAALAKAGGKAMFLMPLLAQRLQEAGRIAPGARGSLEALEQAEESWNAAKGLKAADADAVNRKTWDQHGWAPGDVFGKHSEGNTMSPVSWHDMPNMDYVHLDKMTRAVPLRNNVAGISDIEIAAPEVANMPFEATMSPSVRWDQVGGSVANTPRADQLAKSANMRLTGRSKEEMNALLRHEVQHALRMAESNKNIDYGAIGRVLHDLPATDKLKKLRQSILDKQMSVFDRRAGTSGPEREAISAELKGLDETGGVISSLRDDAPRYGSYLRSPHEVEARTTNLAYLTGQNKNMPYPADVNAYQDEALWPIQFPDYIKSGGISLEDYKPAPFAEIDPREVARFSKLLP